MSETLPTTQQTKTHTDTQRGTRRQLRFYSSKGGYIRWQKLRTNGLMESSCGHPEELCLIASRFLSRAFVRLPKKMEWARRQKDLVIERLR